MSWQTGSVNSGPVSSLLTQHLTDNVRNENRSIASRVSSEALSASGYECGGHPSKHETSVQVCSNAGPLSSMVTYIRPAFVWRLVVALVDPVLQADLTHSVLCNCFAVVRLIILLAGWLQFLQGK